MSQCTIQAALPCVPRPSSRPTHHCSTAALQSTFLLQTRAVTGTRVGGGGGGIILHLRTAQWHTEKNLEAGFYTSKYSVFPYSILPIPQLTVFSNLTLFQQIPTSNRSKMSAPAQYHSDCTCISFYDTRWKSFYFMRKYIKNKGSTT